MTLEFGLSTGAQIGTHHASSGRAMRCAERLPLAWWVRTAAVLAALALVPSGAAQTAGMMTFQALLRDANGTPVDGPVTVSFTIVDAAGVQQDASGNGSIGPEDTFVASGTANAGVVSLKYGPVAPSAFSELARYLRANVTSPALGQLNDVEIVTPPAIAEQLNARGTGTAAMVAASNGRIGIGTADPQDSLHISGGRLMLDNGYFLRWRDVGGATRDILTLDATDSVVLRNAAGNRNIVLNPDLPGNVGIGTATPAAPLHIAGNPAIRLQRTMNGIPRSWGLEVENDGTFRIKDNTVGVNVITCAVGGSVGIGTTTPHRILEVAAPPPLNRIRMSRTDSTEAAGGIEFAGSPGDDASVTWSIGTNMGVPGLGFEINNLAGNQFFMTTNGSVGLGTQSPGERLHVNGSIRANGNVFATCGTLVCSDARFKANFTPLRNSLNTLDALRPVRFDWRCSDFPDRNFDDTPQIGFIAQELLEVVPEVVQQGSDGYYSVDYGRLTPVLTAAIQELHEKLNTETAAWRAAAAAKDERIAQQDRRIDELTLRLEKLEQALAAMQAEVRP